MSTIDHFTVAITSLNKGLNDDRQSLSGHTLTVTPDGRLTIEGEKGRHTLAPASGTTSNSGCCLPSQRHPWRTSVEGPTCRRVVPCDKVRTSKLCPVCAQFLKKPYAPVAQLDRVSVFETEGWEFEPLRARHKFQ
jgi:hypothetical protein